MSYALVKAGTAASGTTSVTPAFGQATGAGNLLVCWAAGDSTLSVTGTGWVIILGAGATSAVAYKPNSSAGESAPTIGNAGGSAVFAALAEFSGGATSSPADQSQPASTLSSPVTATNATADHASGELVLSAFHGFLTKAGTTTTATTLNNGAVSTLNLNNDASSVSVHYRFCYGITTGNSTGDSSQCTNSSKNLGTQSLIVASFLLPSVAARSLVYADRRVARNSLLRR